MELNQKSDPLVSFGIPVRNGASHLTRLLESIINQEYSNIEAVVIDNASTDATRSIVERIASEDNRVRYLRNEEDIGQIENFNRAFLQSKGYFFRWIGTDDWLYKGYVSACVRQLIENPDAIGCSANWVYRDDYGNDIVMDYDMERLEANNPLRRTARMLWFLQAQTSVDPIYSMLRRDVLLKTRLLPVGPWTDRILALELAAHGRFVHEHETLYVRRNAREGARERLSRYHPQIKGLTRANETRIAPRWTMYRDLLKEVDLSFLDRTHRLGIQAMIVVFGVIHHLRAIFRRIRR